MQAEVYNQKGEVLRKIDLPARVFSAPWRADLVHQVVWSMQSNARAATAHAKGRGEVRGGGRKPWRQKGTGRARHGSTRSPIWVGGGVTHGPHKDKSYKKLISKKMRAQALFSVLSRKLASGEIVFVDSLSLPEKKTKQALEVLRNIARASGSRTLSASKKKVALLALWGRDEGAEKSFRNLPQVEIAFLRNLNVLDALNRRFLLIENPEESVKFLQSRG